MRHLCRALFAALAALSVVVTVAQADPPAGAGAGKVMPVSSVAGLTAEEILVATYIPFYTGEAIAACRFFAGGKVLFPADGSTCTVKPGTKVLVPLPGVSCSDAEPAPFFGETEAEQRACAGGLLRTALTRSTVTVDGGRPQNVLSDRFLVTTDQFRVDSQPGNPFGADPGPTTVVAVGYLAVVRGLPPGRHTVVTSNDPFGAPFTATFTIQVVPPGRGG